MAKSIRSKIKRQHRAVMREKYEKKYESVRLKKLAAKSEEVRNEMVLLTKENKSAQKTDEKMETDSTNKNSTYSVKSMKNEHGNFPKWMNNRKIKKFKANEKKKQQKKTKRLKK